MQKITRRRALEMARTVGLTATTSGLVACSSGGGGGSGSGNTGAGGSTNPPAGGGASNPARVIVVGAGPAGMTAAHQLRQIGLDVAVFEAAPSHGGRIRHNTSFTDFPIALGGEWLHVGPEILDEIVNDSTVSIATPTVGYQSSDTYGHFDGTEYTEESLGNSVSDLVFVEGSWLEFFERLILPGIADAITYNAPVTVLDSRGDGVAVHLQDGRIEQADHVVMTAPLQMLKNETIEFLPRLSNDALQTIDEARVWTGFKAFFEFDEAFYPTFLDFPDANNDAGQRTYYNAAHGRNTSANILGLFSVGEQAQQYQSLTAAQLRDRVLSELDVVFNGRASSTYVRHISQNWQAQPFVESAYLADVARNSTSRALAAASTNKVLFAGEAYTREFDWGSVHAAARSARAAVEEIQALVGA